MTENPRVLAEFNRLKKLNSMKDRPEAEVMKVASDLIHKRDVRAEFLTGYMDKAEKKYAEELTFKYLNDYSIESISDKNTLKEIIKLEVTQIRLHQKMDELYEKNNKAVPINMLEVIHKNLDAIVKLKTTLGLNKSKEKHEPYDVLQKLIKRGKAWREENQASRESKCPHCQQLILWMIRTEAWELKKHPFFKDNRVYNKKLFDSLGQTCVIDEKFISEVLETSPNYIGWMIEKSRRPNPSDSLEEIEDVQTQDQDKSTVVQESVQLLERETPQQDVPNSEGQSV